MTGFPIERTPTDILRIIFQARIDEEAALIRPSGLDSFDVRKPRAVASISLVCRLWKIIAYDTPSLWSIIILNMTDPAAKVQAYCNRLATMSKRSPVDLYVLRLHRPGTSWIQAPRNCCSHCPCRVEGVAISLNVVENIHKLYIGAWDIQSFRAFEPCLPRIDKITDISITFRMDPFMREWEPSTLQDSTQLLNGMKNLSRLFIGEIGIIYLLSAGDHPLLPTLRRLELARGQYPSYPTPLFLNILSHCPNIELLDYSNARLTPIDRIELPSITLNYLKTILSSGSGTDLHLFTNHIVQVPILVEFRCANWFGGWNPSTKDFLIAAPTITDITLGFVGADSYALALSGAPQLEHLRLTAYGATVGRLLTSLIEPVDSNGMYCLQSLRTLQIECWNIESIWFQKLARSRFIRSTTQSYRSIEVLKLHLPRSPFGTGISQLENTPEWRSAEVTKRRHDAFNDSYELRWIR